MTREIRQATKVTISNAGRTIDLETPVRVGGASNAGLRAVRWDCSTTSCTRDEGAIETDVAGGPDPVAMMTGVATGTAFGLSGANANFVSATVRLQPAKAPGVNNPVAFNDGVELRSILTVEG